MKIDFTGETVLVAGAAGGIGLAACRYFKDNGAIVIGLDLKKAPIADHSVECDISDDASVAEAVSNIQSHECVPSILVHAAALCETGGALETPPAYYLKTYDINVVSAVRLVQAFAPAMIESGTGSIVFVSSINAQVATPSLSAYAASKGALDTLTKTLALELAPQGVRVNAVSPASVETPLLLSGFASQPDPEASKNANIKRHPLGRLGTAEDVAALIAFLASNNASWITGAIHRIDGGALTTRR